MAGQMSGRIPTYDTGQLPSSYREVRRARASGRWHITTEYFLVIYPFLISPAENMTRIIFFQKNEGAFPKRKRYTGYSKCPTRGVVNRRRGVASSWPWSSELESLLLVSCKPSGVDQASYLHLSPDPFDVLIGCVLWALGSGGRGERSDR